MCALEGILLNNFYPMKAAFIHRCDSIFLLFMTGLK